MNPSLAQVENLESRRLFSYGQPVTDFGVAGVQTAVLDSTRAAPEKELLVDKAGRIIGVSGSGLARYTAAGALDQTFGTAGITALPNVIVTDAAIDSNGKIVILATGTSGTLLLRYTAAGKTDSAFGVSGVGLVTSKKSFHPSALAIQSDGKFVIAGTVPTEDNEGTTSKVYRLTTSLTGDTTFDSDGVADFQLAPEDLLNPTPLDAVSDVAVAADGGIVVLGGTQVFSPSGFDSTSGEFFDASYGAAQLVAVKFANDGTVNTAFGVNGFARASLDDGSIIGNGYAAKALADGSFALAGTDHVSRPLVARFDQFGTLLRRDRAISHPDLSTVLDIAQLSDGRLVLLGSGVNTSIAGHGVRTLAADGTFGPVVLTQDADGNSLFANANTVQLATTGNDILVAGESNAVFQNQQIIKLDAGTTSDAPDRFDNGTVSDVAVDSKGGTHLAYYNSVTTKLMYAFRSSAGVWNDPIVIDGNPLAGSNLSIAVDSANHPLIAYYDANHADLKLAQYTGKKWVFSTIDSKGAVGQYPSLSVGSAGEIALAYYSRTSGDLKFAIYENRAWTYETIDTKNDTGRHVSLAFTPVSRVPSVAYTDDKGSIKYGVRSKAGKWSLTLVNTVTGGTAYLDLAYGGDGARGYISYQAVKPADLMLSYFDGAAWKSRALATNGAAGYYSHLDLRSNQVRVYAYNRSTDRMSLITTDYGSTTSAVKETPLINSFGRNLSAGNADDGSIVFAGIDTASGDLKVNDVLI